MVISEVQVLCNRLGYTFLVRKDDACLPEKDYNHTMA